LLLISYFSEHSSLSCFAESTQLCGVDRVAQNTLIFAPKGTGEPRFRRRDINQFTSSIRAGINKNQQLDPSRYQQNQQLNPSKSTSLILFSSVQQP
jgi:hypothetical protein